MDFEKKLLSNGRFSEEFCFQKNTFGIDQLLPDVWHILHFSYVFKIHDSGCKVYNLSDFQWKTNQHVKSRKKLLTTCQILEITNFKRASFWIESFQRCQNLKKKFVFKKVTFQIILLRKNGMFRSLPALLRIMISTLNFYNASDFE